MFKLVDEPQFTHTIKAKVPVDGGFADESFKATYRVLDASEIAKFDLNTEQGSTEFLQRVVVKLDDIADAEGNPVPWSDKVRDAVLQLPYARRALSNGYFDAINGAKSGN